MGRLNKLKRQAMQEANKRVLGIIKEETDPYADKRYDPDSDEWVGKEKKEENEISGLVSDLRYIMDDIIKRSSTLEDYKRREVEDDIQSLDHKIAVLWEKVQYYDKGEEYVDYDGEPLVNPTFDGPDVEYGDEEDERRYDDRENYGTDDESRYDERNYKYGNHPDDDYED